MRVLLLLLLGVSGCAATDETTPRAEDHFDHALAAARDGALDRAEEQALMALKLDPRNAKAHHLYAFLLAEQNRPEEAIVGFKRSLSIDPTSAATLYDLRVARGNPHIRFVRSVLYGFDDAVEVA